MNTGFSDGLIAQGEERGKQRGRDVFRVQEPRLELALIGILLRTAAAAALLIVLL